MIKFTTQVFCLATLALGIANAATPYDVKLTDAISVGKTQLKPGDYKVEMLGDKAVFKIGRKTVEVPATLEKSEQMYSSTSVVWQKSQLKEIEVGGTQDRIVFGAASSPGGK